METFPYLLAGLIGLIALVMSVLHALHRLKESGEIIAKAAARKEAQSQRVRRVAQSVAGIRVELAAAKRRKAIVEQTILDLQDRLGRAGADNKRILVLDERRNKSDGGWLVKVANPDYATRVSADVDDLSLDDWRRGRRFVLWAPDEQKARDKVLARYPEKRGFYIQGVEPYAR